MGLISAESLKTCSKYIENKVKLKVIHFCPLDGPEGDPKSKRIVVTSDVSQPQQQQPIERYLVIVFYGVYAKTPFKKTALKVGQLFTLSRFETELMPKNKVFKCSGHLLTHFYEPLILVKPEMEPIIKMMVSLREESSLGVIQDNDSVDDRPTEPISGNRIEDKSAEEVSKHVKSPPKKKLKFSSSEEELDLHLSSDEDFENTSKRTLKSRTNTEKNRENKEKRVDKRGIDEMNRNKIHNKSNISRTNGTNSGEKSWNTRVRRHEYKTLIEVHNLMPVSGRTYCHIYGVLRYRDFRQNTIHLRDEKAFTFTIQLRPGNTSFRHYPAFKPGDLLRIHRILLAPNLMDIICTDPKDVVAFEAFQDSESFSPINTSLNPTFEEFDRHRKQEMEEWFSDELLTDCLSEKKSSSYSTYTDLAVQVLRVTTSRDRSYLIVWDTTRPALATKQCQVSTNGMILSPSDEELVRIINQNEMAILVTAYEQHSMDSQSLKPFDFIVLFNVNVRTDRYNKDCFTYTLNSSYGFGKCIRFVKPNSCLGKKLFARIDEYKVMSAVNTSDQSNEEMFASQESLPMDIETNGTNVASEESAIFSEMDDFEIDTNEMAEILEREESYLPTVHIVDIPENNVLINDMIANGVDKQLYKVKARVINYLPSNDKIDIICVLCTNQDCHRIIPLRKAISFDPLIETILESSKDKKQILNCFKCKQSSCVLVFKMVFVIEDNKHKKLLVQLFGHNAELFFNSTPEEVLQTASKWYYVERALNYICAKMSSIDSNKSNNVLLYWVLQPSKVEDKDVFLYHIRTAVAIETADKCVGLNLN